MSKKRYKALASALHKVYYDLVFGESDSHTFTKEHIVFNACTEAIADRCSEDNVRFDRVRFYAAIYGEK